jgi:hypothetical protein
MWHAAHIWLIRQPAILNSVSSQPAHTPLTDIGASISGVGTVSAATLRSRRRSWLRDPCPPHEQPWSSGLPAGTRAGGRDPRAGARADSAGVGARTYLVSGLAAPISGSTWSCPPHAVGDRNRGTAAVTGGTGGRRSAAPGCISSACGSSVQVSSKDRWRFSTWQKTGNTGEPMAVNNVRAQASPGQAGPPPASCVAASANRPVGQA